MAKAPKTTEKKVTKKETPIPPVQEVEVEVKEEFEVTEKTARKIAEDHVLPEDVRYSEVNYNGVKTVVDRCSPTFVSEDGQAFHANKEGEAIAHARQKGLKLFRVYLK